jgi:hypothetical protein
MAAASAILRMDRVLPGFADEFRRKWRGTRAFTAHIPVKGG